MTVSGVAGGVEEVSFDSSFEGIQGARNRGWKQVYCPR